MARLRTVAALVGAALFCAVPASSGEVPRRSAAEVMDILMWNREPVGGPFALTDHAGQARTEADYRGRLLLVYFGYTSCPDVCPTDLQEIARALDLLGAQSDAVQPLFITLDPARDTAEHLSSYVAAFHPRLVGLTGSAEAIHRAADAYKVFYERVTGDGGDEEIVHSAFIYLMDRDGSYLGFFPPGTRAERMLTIIRPHLTPGGVRRQG